VFGGENRRFVVAVRSSQAGVMAPFGEAVIDRLSVSGVVHCPTPFLSCIDPAAHCATPFTVTPSYGLRGANGVLAGNRADRACRDRGDDRLARLRLLEVGDPDPGGP
jgi:hypothetical protein